MKQDPFRLLNISLSGIGLVLLAFLALPAFLPALHAAESEIPIQYHPENIIVEALLEPDSIALLGRSGPWEVSEIRKLIIEPKIQDHQKTAFYALVRDEKLSLFSKTRLLSGQNGAVDEKFYVIGPGGIVENYKGGVYTYPLFGPLESDWLLIVTPLNEDTTKLQGKKGSKEKIKALRAKGAVHQKNLFRLVTNRSAFRIESATVPPFGGEVRVPPQFGDDLAAIYQALNRTRQNREKFNPATVSIKTELGKRVVTLLKSALDALESGR